MAEPKPFRILPQLTPENEFFWTAGAEGKLRMLRCPGCATWVHPPSPVCPDCLGTGLEAGELSGRGRVLTYTVNHHPWIPGFDPPYVVAIVELEEQEGLRLTTNIVGCEPEDVSIDMPVRVRFEEAKDGIFLPLFEPSGK